MASDDSAQAEETTEENQPRHETEPPGGGLNATDFPAGTPGGGETGDRATGLTDLRD